MNTVIFVDDEMSILEGLRRNLRRMRKDWDMHFISEPLEALEFVRAQHVDVIVSDMRMPGLNGAALLQAVQVARPETLRLALSGYADSELILESVHTIHRYIAKPAEMETIRDAVMDCLALKDRLADPALSVYIGGLGAVPSLPQACEQLRLLAEGDEFDLDAAAVVIEGDVGLSTTVLKIVNSAFFGNFGSVESVKQAVSTLGSDTIKNIVLTDAMVRQYGKDDTGELLRLNQLADSVGELAGCFASSAKLGKQTIELSQLAGRLCTVGDIIALDYGKPPCMETDVDFSAIGAYLLSLWGIADPVAQAVARHRVKVDLQAVPNSEGVDVADCVRAAWIALNTDAQSAEELRTTLDTDQRDALSFLAQDDSLANKWCETVT